MGDPPTPTCWINTVSRAHVRAAVEGGFTQADHGRPTRLERLRRNARVGQTLAHRRPAQFRVAAVPSLRNCPLPLNMSRV